MKKLIAINGSPRRNWNTAELLKHAMQGAQDAGTTAELVNLYTLNFKGCTSCFACKIKTRPHGICAMKDDLAPVLEQVKDADAIMLGMTEFSAERILGVAPKILRAYDTVQFKDYSRYESSIFDADEKFAHRAAHFAEDCAAAYEIGRDLVSR